MRQVASVALVVPGRATGRRSSQPCTLKGDGPYASGGFEEIDLVRNRFVTDPLSRSLGARTAAGGRANDGLRLYLGAREEGAGRALANPYDRASTPTKPNDIRGLVRIRSHGGRLRAFRSPPVTRSPPPDAVAERREGSGSPFNGNRLYRTGVIPC